MNGTETTNQTEAVLSVYYITLNKLISGTSVSSIRVVKTGTQATITVDLPKDVQLSGAPLSGKYRIKCIDPEGYTSFSHDLSVYSNYEHVNDAIMQGCDRLYDLTEVHESHHYSYRENGQAWLVRFIGMNAKPGQFEIVPSEVDPLKGGNITYYSNTTVPYSTNLFYEPVPFEMLRTFETKP